jgi:hypothetical protein
MPSDKLCAQFYLFLVMGRNPASRPSLPFKLQFVETTENFVLMQVLGWFINFWT